MSLHQKSNHRKKVLFVDEELQLTAEVKENFALKSPDIDIQTVHTYREACDIISKGDVDLILLDVIIPIENDDKLISNELRNNYNTGIIFKKFVMNLVKEKRIKRPKILYFTARTNLTAEDRMDTDGYINKPKRPSEIIQKVKNELLKVS